MTNLAQLVIYIKMLTVCHKTDCCSIASYSALHQSNSKFLVSISHPEFIECCRWFTRMSTRFIGITLNAILYYCLWLDIFIVAKHMIQDISIFCYQLTQKDKKCQNKFLCYIEFSKTDVPMNLCAFYLYSRESKNTD